MTWPNDQQRELMDHRLDFWWDTRGGLFVLHGYAGTSKTTTVKAWAERRRLPIVPAAPTGKAAALWDGGSTVHRLLNARPLDPHKELKEEITDTPEGKRKQVLRAELARRQKDEHLDFVFQGAGLRDRLVVVDEALMVTRDQRAMLERTGARIIALGDPFQLPPVNYSSGFDGEPDFLLTKVERNTGKVLQLATHIREGDNLSRYELGNLLKGDGRSARSSSIKYADSVLGATHSGVDSALATLVGDTSRMPRRGDVLMAYKNGPGVYNGQRFRLKADATPRTRGKRPPATCFRWARAPSGLPPDRSWTVRTTSRSGIRRSTPTSPRSRGVQPAPSIGPRAVSGGTSTS